MENKLKVGIFEFTYSDSEVKMSIDYSDAQKEKPKKKLPEKKRKNQKNT